MLGTPAGQIRAGVAGPIRGLSRTPAGSARERATDDYRVQSRCAELSARAISFERPTGGRDRSEAGPGWHIACIYPRAMERHVLTILVSLQRSRRWIHITAIFAQRVSRRAARNVAVVGVVSCLAVTGYAAAVHGAGAASSSVDDRVRLACRSARIRAPTFPTFDSPPAATSCCR